MSTRATLCLPLALCRLWLSPEESGLCHRCQLQARKGNICGSGQAILRSAMSWAEDVAAAIDQLSLEKPILVGWSYGGFVIGDYLQRFGGDDIGGINLVAAAIVLNGDAFGTFIGPSFFELAPAASTPELAENIRAIRAFLRACTAEPLDAEDFETWLAFNMVVPPWVRRYMTERALDFGSTYSAADALLRCR